MSRVKVNKEQLIELFDLAKEVAEWDEYYSSTRIKIKAIKILKSIKDKTARS